MTWLDTFRALPAPAAKGSYSVEPDRGQRLRIGRSFEGHPAVLLRFTRECGSPRLTLATLAYLPPTEVTVIHGAVATTRVAILECRSFDLQLTSYFFRVVSSLIDGDASTEDEAQLVNVLETIVALFRALQRPGTKTVEGLWAELAMIAWSARPALAIQAWHSDPHALHDFSVGHFRLEIKSTAKPLREHHFLLDQLLRMDHGMTVIASVMLQRDATSGVSISELVERIRSLVPQIDVQSRLETIVIESLGTAWCDAEALRFNLDQARASLHLYKTDQIPSVPQPLPAGVRDVRFIADLSDIPSWPLAEARAISEFYDGALPSCHGPSV